MKELTSQNTEDPPSTGASSPWWTSETVAVVTGANKGIGFEIVRKLAAGGMTVVLTARDEGRGLKACGDLHAENLKNVVFHKLDVGNPHSVTEFVNWLTETYHGLDILVNNAALFSLSHAYDKALESMNINYFGTMNLTETLLPLFKEGGRIINISSIAGFLSGVNDAKLRQQLSDPSQFDQDFVNKVAEKYLAACQAGSEEVNGYATSVYKVSKVLLNAYTRLLAERAPKLYVHCVHPGLVETDMMDEYKKAITIEGFEELLASGKLGKEGLVHPREGSDTAAWLTLRPPGGPSGLFWYRRAVLSFYDWDSSQ